jgi:hypothetical protein
VCIPIYDREVGLRASLGRIQALGVPMALMSLFIPPQKTPVAKDMDVLGWVGHMGPGLINSFNAPKLPNFSPSG